jgi:hypothetical protein
MHSEPIATYWVRKIAANLPALVVALAVGACGTSDHRPTQPVLDATASAGTDEALGGDHRPDQRPGRKGFFPLDIGNCWTYTGSLATRIEGDSLMSLQLFGEQRKLTGTEVLFGRTYVVEEQKQWPRLSPFPPSDSTTYWVRYRQDRAGLYEADVPLIQPPDARLRAYAQAGKSERSQGVAGLADWHHLEARVLAAKGEAYQPAVRELIRKVQAAHAALRYARLHPPKGIGGPPGGALPNELTRLKYPLHPGQEWTLRAEPIVFTSRVERHEVLRLPAGRMPGFRIRILIEGLDPSDEVFMWYGRKGFLRMRYLIKSVATDPEGNPIGTLISERHLGLESIELIR